MTIFNFIDSEMERGSIELAVDEIDAAKIKAAYLIFYRGQGGVMNDDELEVEVNRLGSITLATSDGYSITGYLDL